MVGVGDRECEDWWECWMCVVRVSRKTRPMLRLPIVSEGFDRWEVLIARLANSRQACTGATVAVLAKDTMPDLAALSQFDHSSVMSLFCEPLRDFTPWDVGASVQRPSLLAASRDRRRRWRRTVRKDTKPLVDGGG